LLVDQIALLSDRQHRRVLDADKLIDIIITKNS
jgi:hypothetical protein